MLSPTEITRRNFNRALLAIHRGDPVARKVVKAAIPIEDREAALEEREMRSAFTDAYADLHRHRGRKVAKVAVVDHSTARSRRLEKAALNERINAAIADIHRGKKVVITSDDADRTFQKVAPAWRFF